MLILDMSVEITGGPSPHLGKVLTGLHSVASFRKLFQINMLGKNECRLVFVLDCGREKERVDIIIGSNQLELAEGHLQNLSDLL